MGVEYPLDLVVCTALGVDQYDCVYPTRTARFGVALLDSGQLRLKAHEFATCKLPIEEGCPCQACTRKVSRSRLHALLKSSNNTIGVQLLTQHNVCYKKSDSNNMSHLVKNDIGPSSKIYHVLNVRFIEHHGSSLGMQLSVRVLIDGSCSSHTQDASRAIPKNNGTGNVQIVDRIGKFRGRCIGHLHRGQCRWDLRHRPR